MGIKVGVVVAIKTIEIISTNRNKIKTVTKIITIHVVAGAVVAEAITGEQITTRTIIMDKIQAVTTQIIILEPFPTRETGCRPLRKRRSWATHTKHNP